MAGSDRDGPDGTTPSAKKSPLTGRTLGHFLWMFAGGGTEAILKIVVLLFLARLLLPEEFGIVSAALTVVALAEVTGRIGVAPSIIQTKTLTRDHIATGMVATLVMGSFMAALIYILAEPISRLYRMPDLVPLIEAFALLFIIKGAGLVSEALLQRQMRFRQIALMRVIGFVVGSAAVSITLAWLGFGAWALVIGQLCHQLLMTLLYLFAARDGLAIGFHWPTFVTMFRFGFGVTLTQIGGFASQNADYFIVGRWLGAEALGYYSRAHLLLKQAAQVVGRMGDQVLFPTLASIQDDTKRLQRALNRALSLSAMTQIPLTALLVISGPEIIHVLMGPQWDPAILPFQIMISVLFFRTAYQFVGATLRAAGKVYHAALWQWSYASMVVLGALLGQSLGLWGVAIGVSAAIVFCHLFGLALVHRYVGVGTRASLSRLVAYACLGAALALLLIAVKAALMQMGLSGPVLLAAMVAGFAALYLGLFTATPRLFGEEGDILRDQMLNRLRRRAGS